MAISCPHDVLVALEQLAKDAGCTVEERHDTHRAPHYKFPVHEHRYIFRTADGVVLEFKTHGARLPLTLGSKKGREMVAWFKACRREALRSYA